MTIALQTQQAIHLEGKDGLFVPHKIIIKLRPEMIHEISTKSEKNASGKWIKKTSYQIGSPEWDVIGRILGMSFQNPKTKYSDENRVIFEVSCRYYNEYGNLIEDSAEYEIDCFAVYQKMRADWKPKVEWVGGQPTDQLKNKSHEGFPKNSVTYENGQPQIKIVLPEDAELELYNNYLTLIRNKHSKAQTCCRRSLVQKAVGQKLATKVGDVEPVLEVTRFAPMLSAEDSRNALASLKGDVVDLTAETSNESLDDGLLEMSPIQETVATSPNMAGVDFKCSQCQTKISEKVDKFSREKHGKALCMNCQGAAKK